MRLSLEYFFSNESCEDFSLLARLWSTSIVRSFLEQRLANLVKLGIILLEITEDVFL